MMKSLLVRIATLTATGALAGMLGLALSGTAAASATGNQGQPNQSCGSSNAMTTPGNAASAPGSAFNPDGKAGTVYAGEQPQNSGNPNAVSQYDVACFQVSQH
ncbi:MAG TPA: hypothetical protein VE343_05975 [Streptosporangiaceae bacterium]|jgi:hypothetical protein|nr:hypothetical protein [Streptosporangiaceae bacterium]